MSWDDDDFDVKVDEVAAVAQAQAKDDEEDLTVKAELAPAAPAPAPAGPAAPETMKNKHIKKEMSKKEALEAEEYRRRWAEEGASTGDAREDELRRRALQEKADLDLAVDSLSIKGFDNKTLVGLMSFSAPSDFEEFGKTIANKVTGSSGVKHDKAVTFFKVLLQTATESYFTLDEIKEVTKVLNNAATKKQQEKKPAEKAKAAPAAAKTKAPKAYVGRDDDYDYDEGDADEYGDIGGAAVPETAAVAPTPADDFM